MHPLRMNGAACLLIACVTIGACAQAADPLPLKNAVPGGWSSAPVDDARVKLAAQNAVAAQSLREGRPLELKSIAGVERQVVAGINYRMRLVVIRDGAEAAAAALVWGKLNGSYELTSWTWE